MTAYYLGGFTLGECLPIAVQAKGGLDAAVAVALPKLTAEVAGAIEAEASLTLEPPTLEGNLAVALELVQQLEAAIAVGLPTAQLDLAVIGDIVADLQAELGALQVQADLSLDLAVILGGAGVHLVTQQGTLGTLGSDIASVAPTIGAGSTACNAVCLVATTPEAWSAISAAVKVS